MPKSYTYVGKNTTEDECVMIHGIFEMEVKYHHFQQWGNAKFIVNFNVILDESLLHKYI